HGATLVVNAELPVVTPPDVIHSIAAHGWHILTVDDARRMIEGRDIAASEHGYLTPGNDWLTTTEKNADALQIAESLFPFCEQVVATRTAMMVIYTPGLPKPLRLWRLSLKGIMPSLPPAGPAAAFVGSVLSAGGNAQKQMIASTFRGPLVFADPVDQIVVTLESGREVALRDGHRYLVGREARERVPQRGRVVPEVDAD
ncbi:hypothetical protein KXV85_001692, partial [Aspergillus fumigatus]